jgi:hypothetical protein
MLIITITIVDIIYCPVFYLKHVSEAGFCLRLQVEPKKLGPIEDLESETSVVFSTKVRTTYNVQDCDSYNLYFAQQKLLIIYL